MNVIFLHLHSANYGREQLSVLKTPFIMAQFLLAKCANVLTLSLSTGHFKNILSCLITLNDFFQL